MSASAVDPVITHPPTQEIGGLARRGAVWTFALIVSRYGVRMLARAVLARILTATDYGLVAMVMTLTAFWQVFADMGLSTATVQRRQLTRAQVDNLFWVNAGVGALLWLGCVAAGPLVSRFYGRDELAGIAAVLGAGFLLGGLGVQPRALLHRQLRLKAVSFIEIAATVAGAVVGVALALSGWGYWALVGQSLATELVQVSLILRHTEYRPRGPKFDRDTFDLIRFGGSLSGSAFLSYVAFNADNVLIGKHLGPEQLEYYTRAYFLITIPSLLAAASLSRVMVPALSALQSEPHRMADAYRQATSFTALVGVPLGIGLAVMAPEVVRILYGPSWAPVAPILVWLAIAGAIQPMNTFAWLYVATGKGRQMFLWNLARAAILVAGFSLAIYWGTIGVAKVYALLMVAVLFVPGLYFAHRTAGIATRPTLSLLVRPIAAGLLMGSLMIAAGGLLTRTGMPWLQVVAVKIGLGAATYGLLLRGRFRALYLVLRPSLESGR